MKLRLKLCLSRLVPTNDEMLQVAKNCDFSYYFWLGLGNIPPYLAKFRHDEGSIVVKHHQLKEFEDLLNM